MRLSTATLDRLAPDVSRFRYDRDAQATGIVHIGIGAFHRAHQAWYTDLAMDGGNRDWAITGVSLRSPAVAEQLNPQDGLYTVVENGAATSAARVVGSVREVIVARDQRANVKALLAAASTRIVSFTITEKGYCRAPDGSLDMSLANASSIYPYFAEALKHRRASGATGLTLLSCDNLPGNGEKLAQLVSEYLERHDPGLRRWFEAECACPSTMVDRIVPATTASERARLPQIIGLEDTAVVFTEPFTQWVIEDRFAAGRPDWGKVGAELVQHVAPYEMAKLRLLNGAHSALAYLGLVRGHVFVHEALADGEIRPVVERLMRIEAAASLPSEPGQNIPAYIDMLLDRFANRALNHRLSQIAMDGSQKVPQRWLETLAYHQQTDGMQCRAILTALAAWLLHLRGDNGLLEDPIADQLSHAWNRNGEAGIVKSLFADGGVIASPWRPTLSDAAFIERAFHTRTFTISD